MRLNHTYTIYRRVFYLCRVGSPQPDPVRQRSLEPLNGMAPTISQIYRKKRHSEDAGNNSVENLTTAIQIFSPIKK